MKFRSVRNFILKKIPSNKREIYATTFLNSLGYGETSIESEVLSMINSLKLKGIKQNAVLDIGASEGDWSKKLISLTNNIDVYAFEPSKVAYKKFCSKLSNEILNGRCHARNVGLSSKSFLTKIYSDKIGSGASSMYMREGINSQSFEDVNIIAIDQEIKKIQLPIIAMKIDVEGHEYEILEGAVELMSRKEFTSVQFEFGEYTSERNQNFKQFYDLLSSLNFQIFRISKFGSTKIPTYSPKLEIHWNTNYLAIKN